MGEERNPQAFKLAVKHYARQLRAQWRLFLPGYLLPSIGSTLIFYAPTLVIAKILFSFGQQKSPDLHQLTPYIILLIAIWASGELLWRTGVYFIIKAQVKGSRQLYLDGMNYLLGKDLAFFHDNFSGSLTKRLNGYGWRFIDITDALLFHIFTSYVPILFVFYILWHFSPWLVLTLLVLLIITAGLVFPLVRRRMKIVAVREKAHNTVTGHIADILGNVDTVKAFANESAESKTYRHHVDDWASKARHSWDYQNLRIDVTTGPFYILTNAVGLLLAIYLGHGNATTLKVVYITFSYFTQTTRVIWEFSDIYRRLESSLSEVAQFTELLLEPPKINDPADPATFKVPRGEIEFRNVEFKYEDGAAENLFENFNLNIESGEKIALVGHSGGGKTTVTKLLLRFMDIDGGEILIDGQNIAKIKQVQLRQQIAYVPQEPAMFHRSLRDNIKYGRPEASDRQIEEVAALAHAAEFIDKLPQGYETLVGERGVKLSGGQRQRIAIARAMIKNAPILVLDEATSALDSESEKLIQDALWQLMQGKTVIAIAHRLSTIQKMDRIIVLDGGKIAEQGNHQQLLANKGIYASLWAHQSGGFLED